MLPNVKIAIANGGLGRVTPTPDKVSGLIVTNKASSTIPLGTPFLITSSRQVETLSEDLTPFAKRELLHFFSEAGDGSELYVMPVADTALLDDVVADSVSTLHAYSQGNIRLLGISLNPADPDFNETTELPENFVTDVKALQTRLNALQLAITPSRAIVGLYGFAADKLANLPDRASFDTPNVGVVISCADEEEESLPTVGLALGKLAAISVMVNIGRVKDGPVSIQDAYIGGVKAEQFEGLETLHSKGYIFLRTFPGRSGYYFNDDSSMVAANDDFSSIARGRVIDKALTLVFDTYVEEINDHIQVDANGMLPVSIVKSLEGAIENRINRDMASEISSVSAYIDPAQNVLSTDKLEIAVRIVPLGYLKEIEISLGFENPFQG